MRRDRMLTMVMMQVVLAATQVIIAILQLLSK